MRKLFLMYCSLSIVFAANAAPAKKELTLEDIHKNGVFRVKDVPGFNALKNGKQYSRKEENGKEQFIRIYDLETGNKVSTLFNNLVHKYKGDTLNIESYALSADEKKILLFTQGENIYRRSAVSKVYVFEIASGELQLLEEDKVLHATFSPDASKVAYVKKNNLYYKDLSTGTVTAVTKDGEWNKIINGNCDWVYEEEFGFTKAFDWSKDGKYLAYYRFDESLVPEYAFAKYNGLYPQQYSYKYPKAGEKNSVVQVHIFNINSKSDVIANIGKNNDIYIPRIKWMEKGNDLCIFKLNRLQNKLELLKTNANTGSTEILYKETNTSYIDINDQYSFLPDGNAMIFKTERDGFSHLYYYNWKTDKMNCLTPGSYDVDALVGVDEVSHNVFYTAAKSAPTQRGLYAVNWNGKYEHSITKNIGYHVITPCQGYKYFVDKFSTLNHVPVVSLIDANGRNIKVLEDNSALEKKMSEYDWGTVSFIKLDGAHSTLNGWIIKPVNFDSNKKYPVLMYQYSGPGSQEVADKFPVGNYFWHQYLAQKGYIVVCVDGTGTGFRGEHFKKATYLQLGKYESEDQIAVAKNLGKLPYVDKNRIGIWGWSYGGFMSSTCILKGNDVFKAAIAVAPVTNWRYYDNIYTERYMRTPQENAKGYDDNSPEKMADKLKGKFLMIHGTADDNVHFQNAVMLTNALINANKEFESEYYPDKAHGISGGNSRLHLYTRMSKFILDNL